MSTSILILSPVPTARAQKAVDDCGRRIAELGLTGPEMEVFEEHPAGDLVKELLDDDDDDLRERLDKVESVIAIASEVSLAKDPVFVEALRFVLRRSSDALVQFPDGIAEAEIAMALIASMPEIEDFDEREEARKVHARLLQMKYRILKKRWITGDASLNLRAFSNHEIEAHERSHRVSLPADFVSYLTIVGTGPGPARGGIPPLDEMAKPKTYAKTAQRAKLGKTVIVGQESDESWHILVSDGDYAGTVWQVSEGTLGPGPMAPNFLEYIEAWLGEGEPEPLSCPACQLPLEVKDLEREFCQNCGTRRAAASDLSEAAKAFEALATGLLAELVESELLELEDEGQMAPLVAALSEYMGEKGHKWKSPDRAAASIAGWLLHRDEVAELHGSNSDVARVFMSVGRG